VSAYWQTVLIGAGIGLVVVGICIVAIRRAARQPGERAPAWSREPATEEIPTVEEDLWAPRAPRNRRRG
jgi:hypothetical protein